MAKRYLVLTAVGPDRPGLVDAISEYVFARGGNVESTRAAALGGEFAIIMWVSADAKGARIVEDEIGTLTDTAGLSCTAKSAAAPNALPAPVMPYDLTVHAMDHPGIVRAVTHELAKTGVNIESLDTHVESAPHTGTAFFNFHARLNVPSELNLPHLRGELEALGNRFNVDVQLTAAEE